MFGRNENHQGTSSPASSSQEDLSGSLRAAMYVRMSTDHQKYSTENQSDAIRKYAEERGFELVRSYADAGKSGRRERIGFSTRDWIEVST